MKLLIKLPILIGMLLSAACSRNEPEADFVSLGVSILVKDSASRNLLNPVTTNHYDPKNIKVYYLKEGQLVEAISPNGTNQPAFEVNKFEPNGEYYMSLQISPYSPSMTYIKWSQSDVDTLECSLIREKGTLSADKLMWNGVEKFKNNDSTRPTNWGTTAFGRFFEVEKH